MRDINRIYDFCKQLAEYWTKVPDWRFTQLISNVFGDWHSKNSQDIFFLEEDEVLEIFEEYFGN